MTIKVLYVTHLFDLAEGFWSEGRADALFLRAERRPDGVRTFRIIEGEPLPTSFGEDVYRRVFEVPPKPPRARPRAIRSRSRPLPRRPDAARPDMRTARC